MSDYVIDSPGALASLIARLDDEAFVSESRFVLPPDAAVLRLHIAGEQYHRSVPTSAMKAVLAIQDAVNRIYRVQTRIPRTTLDVARSLELVAVVEDGSTNLIIEFGKLVEGAFSRMNGTQALIGIGILTVGALGFRVTSARETAELARIEASQQTEAVQVAHESSAIAFAAGVAAMRNIARTDPQELAINGDPISQDELAEAIRIERPRVETETVVVRRPFLVRAIHWQANETYIVVDDPTGEVALPHVVVPDSILSPEQYRVLENAENRAPVELRIVVQRRGERVTTAILTDLDAEEE